eukprot:3431029-Amphidinium_carterae.1
MLLESLSVKNRICLLGICSLTSRTISKRLRRTHLFGLGAKRAYETPLGKSRHKSAQRKRAQTWFKKGHEEA